MEYNFCPSFLNLAVWFMIIQSCTGDLLLYKSAQETEPPVGPSDISGWAWLGSGQWVVCHRGRVWAGSRNLASSDSNSKRALYTH